MYRWLKTSIPGYDLVHIHALFSFSSTVAAWIARRCGIPYVIRPLGTLAPYGMKRRRRVQKLLSFNLVEKHLLQAAASIHVTSNAEKADALCLGVVGKFDVIPLGVEAATEGEKARFERDHPQIGVRRIVLYLSRLDPKKNLESLLRAFAGDAWLRKTATLVIAGDGSADYRHSLGALATSLGIADAMIWMGPVSEIAKADALAAADVFALPSFSENFGIAVAEALASGIPCVLGRGVAIAAEVEKAGAGFAVDPTPEAIAEGISRLLGDESAHRAAAAAARRLADERYSAQRMGQELVALYGRIVAERRVLHA